MKRVLIFVEGQTEEILADYLIGLGIYLIPIELPSL